jgi:REP element-mobilizing transposase RayT
MDDSIAYFLTWVKYGTWLPGDSRGWIEYQRGWQLSAPALELEVAARMTEGACRLTQEQRSLVEQQIEATCSHRHWLLHAVNCRSNHVHVVVSAAGVSAKRIRSDLKSWTSRILKREYDAERENWWAERGSIRFLYDKEALEAAVVYVAEAQDRKHLS